MSLPNLDRNWTYITQLTWMFYHWTNLKMVPQPGIEPGTSTLSRLHSTAELLRLLTKFLKIIYYFWNWIIHHLINNVNNILKYFAPLAGFEPARPFGSRINSAMQYQLCLQWSKILLVSLVRIELTISSFQTRWLANSLQRDLDRDAGIEPANQGSKPCIHTIEFIPNLVPGTRIELVFRIS